MIDGRLGAPPQTRSHQRRPRSIGRHRFLVAALESGHIGGAGVDVTEPELPPSKAASGPTERNHATRRRPPPRADDMTNFFCENPAAT